LFWYVLQSSACCIAPLPLLMSLCKLKTVKRNIGHKSLKKIYKPLKDLKYKIVREGFITVTLV
jgi:hypothetical protein